MAETDKKSNLGLIITSIVLVIVFIICFIALVKFDVAGLGTKVLEPKIKDVPVLNLILPKVEPAINEVTDNEADSYQFDTIEEAVERLKVTEKLLKQKEVDVDNLNEEVDRLTKEVNRLKVFEENQLSFEKNKAEFDELVAEAYGTEELIKYVEDIYPEQALEIYEQFLSIREKNSEAEKIASIYQNMKAEEAAEILEETYKIDIKMVDEILSNIDSEQAGNILSAMDPTIADRILRYMYPED